MTKKRDPIGEILQKRSRSRKRTHRWLGIYDRLKPIEAATDFLVANRNTAQGSNVEELARYIPVALVGALEGYTRVVIRDLINYGNPFRKNAERLEEVRVDLPTILRVQGARISMGEFLAHLLPISSLEDINRHLSTLIGEDCFSRVKKIPFTDEGYTLEKDHPRLWPEITSIFHRRHIISHELGGGTLIPENLGDDPFSVLAFALAVDELMDVLMPPRTRGRVQGMSDAPVAAGEHFSDAASEK